MSQIEINGHPRRYRLEYLTPAERTVFNAIGKIEELGADPSLTEAQELLERAQDMVADFIDRQLQPSEE